jgi:DUF2075 family protein
VRRQVWKRFTDASKEKEFVDAFMTTFGSRTLFVDEVEKVLKANATVRQTMLRNSITILITVISNQ